MVVIKAGVHVEGNQAASEPATEATEEEAHQPGEGTRLSTADSHTDVLAFEALELMRIHVESRLGAGLHHGTTTGVAGTTSSLHRGLLNNNDLSGLHTGLLHLGLLHHWLLLHLLAHHGYLFLLGLSHGCGTNGLKRLVHLRVRHI